jgi:N6-adenosine-specific RNA methylase IME4
MVEWLKGCEVCNAGLCARFDELIESGLSQRVAAKKMEEEQINSLGIIVYPANTLRQRYKRNKPKKLGTDVPKQNLKTCAVSDIQNLIVNKKKFGTIYADPPWQYSNQATRSSTDNHYDTMTNEEIASLPIIDIVSEHAHLHLWTTNAFLFEAKSIIKAWGFEYKSCFVWVKPQMGIGNYWRVSHEFLLFGIKGKCPFRDRGQKSWGEYDRTRHSAKPENIAKIIEKTSPGPYIELFGRQTRSGWTVWGNEIERTLFNEAAFEKNI